MDGHGGYVLGKPQDRNSRSWAEKAMQGLGYETLAPSRTLRVSEKSEKEW